MTRARVYSQTGIGGSGNANVTLSLEALSPFLTTANVRELNSLYYTNSRVLSNVSFASINDLFDVATRFANGDSTAIVGDSLVWQGNVWVPGTITANLLTLANTNFLREGSNNLYYTNARARTAFTAANPTIIIDWNAGTIAANLVAIAASANTTDSVPEGFQNLYYKDSRVFANIKLAHLTDFSDVLTANETYPAGHPRAGNTIAALQTGSSLVWYESAQKWVAERAISLVADYANVAEYANVVLTLSNFTTDNLRQGANNLYLNVNALANILGNISIDALKDVNTSGKANGYVLVWDGFNWVPNASASSVITNVPSANTASFAEYSNIANVALSAVVAARTNFAEYSNIANVSLRTAFAEYSNVANTALNTLFAQTSNVSNIALRTLFANTASFATTANVANLVLSLANFTTSNLAEGSNLYFSTARLVSNLANLSINVFADVDTTFANVGEVLYWTGTQWVANSLTLGRASFADRSNIANLVLSLANFTTSNLAEGVNLYYTNNRVKSVITNGSDTNASFFDITAAGNLTVNGDVVTLNVSNVLVESRTITLVKGANQPYLAEGAGIKIDGANASILYSETYDSLGVNKNLVVHGNIIPAISGRFNLGTPTATWKSIYIGAQTIYLGNTSLSESTAPGGGLTVKDNSGQVSSFTVSNITSFNSVTNSITSNIWTGIYTANVIETANNLYYTTARVNTAVQPMLTTANVIEIGSNLYYTNARVNTAVQPMLTTANVIEIGSNLYYTNARVNTAVQPMLTTANVIEISSNLYFTTSRVNVAVQPMLTTANVIEIGSNLYYTNARVNVFIQQFFTTANIRELGNLYYTDARVNTAVQPMLTTANVIETSGNLYFTNARVLSSLIASNVTVNDLTVTSNLFIGKIINGRSNVGLTLGNTVIGTLVSNAVTLTTETTVTDSITQLNQVLGKLVPARPPAISSASSIAIQTLSSYRMTTVTQTDNTPSSRTVAAGNTVAVVRRSALYNTNTIANVGLADSGAVSVVKNGVSAGTRLMTAGSDVGTYGDLQIIRDVDYSVVTGQASGFWQAFSANAYGSVNGGWNEVYINHTTGGSSQTAYWYYDAVSVAAPQFTNIRIGPTSNVYSNSSTIPHFTSSTVYTLQFDVNRLSGDMFPTSNNFITGTSGGAFLTPTTLTYASAGVGFPLAANLYVASGNVSLSTPVSITSGFGSSAVGCSLTADNSYNTGSGTFTPAGTILYKTGTASAMEETNLTFSSTVGTGSGLAARIENPGSTDNPAYTANAFLFNSQTSTLQTYDATIVAATLKHDQTNYSTGYQPVGPNLSSGRTGSQYFTFKFVRTSVSKFDISFSGTIAGLWVALPGSTIDSTSTINGWLDMSAAYGGSGVPGAGGGGNGTNGCALGGSVTLNTLVSNHRKTCTFGTVSSSSTATNEIYVRIKLTAGQTVSALSLYTASN
jgi:hypothetical protein